MVEENNAADSLYGLSVISGSVTLLLASVLAYSMMKVKEGSKQINEISEESAVSFDKSEFPGGLLTVYFGTQTGTSENFASQLQSEGREHGFFVHPVDLEAVEIEDLVGEDRRDADTGVARCLVFVSTYGEGEATDNATAFAASLREKAGIDIIFQSQSEDEKSTPEPTLRGLEYGVFGLGNRQYDHYNSMGKFVDHAFERVGGNRVVQLGLGDDDDDIEADFEKWRTTVLWPALERRYISSDVDLMALKRRLSSKSTPPVTPYTVQNHGRTTQRPASVSNPSIHGSSRLHFNNDDCPIKSVYKLGTKKDAGATVHVEVDVSNTKMKYFTADNLHIFPLNKPEVVESVAKSLNYDLEECISVNNSNGFAPFPSPLTVRECLTRYMDLARGLRRSDMGRLAFFAEDLVDRQFLKRVSTNEGIAEFKEKVADDFMNMADVLLKCPSISVTLEYFLALCPLMQARVYTISSSSAVHPDKIHLTVSIDSQKKKNGQLFEGLCSSYLARSEANASVRMFVETSTFRLPRDPMTPIIMIGPGTGVAPMRAMLQERAHFKTYSGSIGPIVLYFGCRDRKQDFLYEKELEAFKRDGVLKELYVAFSREQSSKVYVQHLLLENAAATWGLIAQGAHIYVCGAVRMGHDVTEALKKIVATQSGKSLYEAQAYVENLAQKEHRYVSELY